MRLSAQQRDIIREEVARAFGANSRVKLFGSRTDDSARGGDIDLFVETGSGVTSKELLDCELRLHAALQRKLGERRIDIVVHRRGAPERAIDAQAKRSGIPI